MLLIEIGVRNGAAAVQEREATIDEGAKWAGMFKLKPERRRLIGGQSAIINRGKAPLTGTESPQAPTPNCGQSEEASL
jgi:hypothetical protein